MRASSSPALGQLPSGSNLPQSSSANLQSAHRRGRSVAQDYTSSRSSHADNPTPSSPETSRTGRRGLLVVADRTLPSGRGSENEVKRFVSRFGRFDFAGEVVVKGFALFAVDAWVLNRQRLTNTVVNVTGNPTDHVVTYLLTPREDLSAVEGTQEIEDVVKQLRRDSRARPIETEFGVLMVTSLASLSHEVQVISIPGGDYRKVRDDLYVKLNLRKFGCGGRSSLTIDPPTGAVRHKFRSIYLLPTPTDRTPFNLLVIELVRLIQISLFHHGQYCNGQGEVPDGLLCDSTMAGIMDWFRDMYGGYRGFDEADRGEFMESQGPSIVAALFSVITSVRHKLLVLDVDKVPTDPFTKVRDFRSALSCFQRVYLQRRDGGIAHLSFDLIKQITTAYQRERDLDNNKLTRKLRHQVSAAGAGIASNVLHLGHSRKDSDLSHGEEEDVDGKMGTISTSSDALSPDMATINLDVFVRAVQANAKDREGLGAGRIRALWTGQVSPHTPADWSNLQVADPVLDELDEVDEGLSPQKAGEISRFRSNEKRDRGMIRGVTARRGLALKDGITGWAKGTIFGESSDSESPYHGREPPSTHEDYWKSSMRGVPPKLVLPSSDNDEMSRHSTPQPSTKGKTSEARTDDGRSEAGLLGYNIPRPGLVGHASSFNGSDVWGGGPSDANASVSDNLQQPPSQGTADGASAVREPMTHASSAVLPLVRTVSSGAKAAIDEAGLEYIHEGHGMVAVEAHLLRRPGSASRTRRSWSFSDLSDLPRVQVLPIDMMATDVGLCDVVWRMRTRLDFLRGSVVSLKAIEKAMYDVSSAFVDEVRSRRERFQRLVDSVQSFTGAGATGAAQGASALSTGAATPDDERRPPPTGIGVGFQSTRRADREVEEKQKKLHYSLMDLDRTVASLEYARATWEGYLSEYGLADGDEPKRREASKSDEVDTTWSGLGWLRRWTPRGG